MFLRLLPRNLSLLILGFVLPILIWQATVTKDRWRRHHDELREDQLCAQAVRTLAGAVEMYELDYNTRVERVSFNLLLQLTDYGYLQEIPEVPGHGRCDGRTYALHRKARHRVLCMVHGDGRNAPPGGSRGTLRFATETAAPYAAGVLVTLLLQSLWAWLCRPLAAPDEATLPEWFTDPVFKPVSKEVIAGLGPDAHCPVCSQHLVADSQSILECLRCATPHHLDCAGYTERCGVYGCGETDPG